MDKAGSEGKPWISGLYEYRITPQSGSIANETRNYVEHNSAENISQDLVHPTKSDIEASASFDSKSEEREEITEIADVPAFTPAHTPAPALES